MQSLFLHRKDLISKPCPNCGSKAWKIGQMLDSGGQRRYPYFCSECGSRTQLYVKKDRALRERPPLIADLRVKKCEVCGELGSQLHHWAPQAIFEDSARWPTSYLCQPCHSRWHRQMDAALVLERKRLRQLVADDSWACSFQTMGQYRSAVLAALAASSGKGNPEDQ